MAAASRLWRFRRLGDGDPRRLRALLALLFVALAIPTGALIWQAYSQLKFEAFYQYRNQAALLVERIDAELNEDVLREEARRFTDFAFLNVAGDPAANVLQRSPLSAYPVAAELPGVLGYFQVGSDGEFSTPLLPGSDTPPEQLGLPADEYALRAALAGEIRGILADNRLVRDGAAPRRQAGLDELPVAAERPADLLSRMEPLPATADEPAYDIAPVAGESQPAEADPAPESGDRDDAYNQEIFDRLNRIQAATEALADSRREADGELGFTAGRSNELGKLEDLALDEDLQKKSEVREQRLEEAEEATRQAQKRMPAPRARRVEQAVLPAAAAPEVTLESGRASPPVGARISTFESEIDPYEFSLLDSGHLVLFRKVWRGGERYIQGLLMDRERFLAETVESTYGSTPLSGMTNLVIGYRDNVLAVIGGGSARRYQPGSGDLQGTLLHRASLSAPFEDLELVFSINRLPPGPGATVLKWTTLVIALVFAAGFAVLYRLGLGQMRLARQQQDFVSAVSHELKTPLTSIRMYSEMLREGWADEAKRRQYYDYIHDESERLTRLISNVLRLASITRNDPQFDLRPATVGELKSMVESKIASQVARAGFELELARDDESDRATIEVDDDCFAQIVINLVDNAIKFSAGADSKTINVSSALTPDGRVRFSIRDYGPGIPKDQMKKIFELFYRSESELTRETVGTGIGLAIVHQLTLAMHGRVDVINRDPGAEFRLTFPVIG